MADLTLRALKAKHGDSLLLFSKSATVLIDGGPSGVYNQTLRDALKDLPRNGEDPPKIDLMMISHIDADHIDGILDLTTELIEASDEEREPLVDIRRAWHNSFSDVIAKAGIQTAGHVTAEAGSTASVFKDFLGELIPKEESTMVLQSVKQGRDLRLDLKRLNIDTNARFKDRLVLQGGASKPWKKRDLTLEVIGPTQGEVDKLREEWKKQLPKILKKEGQARLAAAASLDTSVANLSSVVAIAKSGEKTILLTGDARGDMVLEWLESTDHLEAGKSVHFDVLKLGHHGSDRNVTPEFFERVTADHYVISGNGGHGNPEPATFEMLFKARPEKDYKLHLTYTLAEMKERSAFRKHGNDKKMKTMLEDPETAALFNFPQGHNKFIDVVI